jgi:hypothetical protein
MTRSSQAAVGAIQDMINQPTGSVASCSWHGRKDIWVQKKVTGSKKGDAGSNKGDATIVGDTAVTFLVATTATIRNRSLAAFIRKHGETVLQHTSAAATLDDGAWLGSNKGDAGSNKGDAGFK